MLKFVCQGEDLTAQSSQFYGHFFQFIKQSHCLFLRKAALQLLHGLVIIHANGTVLGVQRGEAGVVIDKRLIDFRNAKGVDIDNEKSKEVQTDEAEFLKAEFNGISLSSLPVDSCLIPYLETRIEGIRQCLSVKASLSAIFLIGSTLEGILLGVASKHPAIYNKANSVPKDTKTGKPRNFNEWTLNNFIDVSYEIGFLKEDVKKFSHALRDFRNYIHPYQQMSIGFQPDEHTARICFQVLKAALYQIEQKSKS